MKARKGYVYFDKNTDSWKARFTYTDNTGKRKNVKRKANSKSHGEEVLKQLIRTYDSGGGAALAAEKVTMNDLCDYYAEHYLHPAQYVGNRKIAGLRSVTSVEGYVKVFREHFGKQKLKAINYEDLRVFKLKRLKTPTQQSEFRSLATVNREMAYLRRLLNIAVRKAWIDRNPFNLGDTLINISDEVKRERILTREEESLLLAACHGPRAHIRPIIIAALDTGCRLGELLKLCWRDVDLSTGIITIQAFNTKTMRERQVAVTSRLTNELESLWDNSSHELGSLVFGIKNQIRKSFRSACKEAGLEGLRIHDLRHTHATRLDDLGFSLAKIGGQLGHTVVQTTLRYVNRNRGTLKHIANALDSYNCQSVLEPQNLSETVN